MLIFLAVVLLLVALFLWRSHNIASLNWPKHMGFLGFQSRVKWMLKKYHWNFILVQKYPGPLMARKGNVVLMIVCLHTRHSTTPLKLADLGDERRSAGSKQIVCVTSEPFSEAFRSEALEKGIFVMYYKQLKDFLSLPSSAPDVVTGYFADTRP